MLHLIEFPFIQGSPIYVHQAAIFLAGASLVSAAGTSILLSVRKNHKDAGKGALSAVNTRCDFAAFRKINDSYLLFLQKCSRKAAAQRLLTIHVRETG